MAQRANIFVEFPAPNCTRPSGSVSCQEGIYIAARWAAKRLVIYNATKILARWAMGHTIFDRFQKITLNGT